MIQRLETLKPIPSCQIMELKFKDGVWTYVYGIKTPEPITDEEKDLIIYGHICNLDVKRDDLADLSVNIHFKTLSEYLSILERQRQADIKYRFEWLEKHPKASLNTVILENRDYDQEELSERITYLSSIVLQTETKTVFAAIL